MRLKAITALTLLMPINLLVAVNSFAEMYKYQDQNGNWYFTDKPPQQLENSAEVIQIGTAQKSISISNDDIEINLQELLSKQYSPDTAVEKASIAVVGIESKLGAGSGFFITETGYIITNKHVIKPSPKTDEILAKFKKNNIKLDEWQQHLKEKKLKLDHYENEIKKEEKYITSNSKSISASDIADFEYRSTEFKQIQNKYQKEENKYIEQRQKNTEAERSFSYAINAAKIANTYKIYIKNQQIYRASLISVSTKYDLALLKIHVKKTPFLTSGNSKKMSQGERVFAIGSPLGQRDSVTSGVITQIRKNVVITDTQILPGNSGGPLINDTGEVIAINTLKISQRKGSEGFGHSIPIETALQEFNQFLITKETHQEPPGNNLEINSVID